MANLFGGLADRLPIAHRGLSMRFPENTVLAFEQALRFPIWGIETDLQLTADGHVVVFHDHELRRVAGSMRPVCDCTLEELQALDLAQWFGGGQAVQTVLTLEQLLTQFGSRTRLLLEIKVNPHARDPLHHRKLMAQTLRLVAEHQLEASTAILCFDFDLLAYGHTVHPQAQMVWNQQRARRSDADGFVAAYSVDFAGLSQAFVQAAHAAGKPVLTFTVNQEIALQQALACRVNGVMSDDAGWLCAAMSS